MPEAPKTVTGNLTLQAFAQAVVGIIVWGVEAYGGPVIPVIVAGQVGVVLFGLLLFGRKLLASVGVALLVVSLMGCATRLGGNGFGWTTTIGNSEEAPGGVEHGYETVLDVVGSEEALATLTPEQLQLVLDARRERTKADDGYIAGGSASSQAAEVISAVFGGIGTMIGGILGGIFGRP